MTANPCLVPLVVCGMISAGLVRDITVEGSPLTVGSILGLKPGGSDTFLENSKPALRKLILPITLVTRDPRGCVHDGESRRHREHFTSNNEDFWCNKRTVYCEPVKGSRTKTRDSGGCNYNGKRRHGEHFFYKNMKCSCYDKVVECDWVKGSRTKTRDSRRCKYNGRRRRHGEHFIENNKQCSCYENEVNCEPVKKSSTPNRDSRGCKYNGKRRRHGKHFTDNNEECSCYDNEVNCEPVKKFSTPTRAINTDCYIGEKSIKGSTQFTSNGQNCVCFKGQMYCKIEESDRPATTETPCENGEISCNQKKYRSCRFYYKTLAHTDVWFYSSPSRVCTCNDSKVTCEMLNYQWVPGGYFYVNNKN